MLSYLASLEGLEPPTCSLEDCHSIQLSYRDILGDPYGIRTRISNVRGCRPKPLDEWTNVSLYIRLLPDLVTPTGIDPVLPG